MCIRDRTNYKKCPNYILPGIQGLVGYTAIQLVGIKFSLVQIFTEMPPDPPEKKYCGFYFMPPAGLTTSLHIDSQFLCCFFYYTVAGLSVSENHENLHQTKVSPPLIRNANLYGFTTVALEEEPDPSEHFKDNLDDTFKEEGNIPALKQYKHVDYKIIHSAQ